jgi:nucleoside-diphosphate-sugar epimerase
MTQVLVTGCAGYIGSVLTRQLLRKEYRVRGLDALCFGGESLLDIINHPRFDFVRGDIRDTAAVRRVLDGVSAVLHLAAIVGDPACAQQPDLAREVNGTATQRLFDLAHETPTVRSFVFASTCSNYGKMMGDGYVTEQSPLRPVSLYAELKVAFEETLLKTPVRKDFAPTSLRFSTVYGLSPRMRFDLTVNEFARELTLGRKLQIFGEQFWRPYCHVDDLARAVVLTLESPPEKTRQQVFNVGDTRENYTKKMIVEEFYRLFPETPRELITYIQKLEDPRDYRVDFSKIGSALGYAITKRLPDGLREIHCLLRNGILSDPDSKRFRNV